MKAIAEYFRDLAADDRYFGAEPPVPDADMLARIAEREIARRVEARLDRGAIVLRAGQSLGSDTAPTEIAAPDVAVPAAIVAEPAPRATQMTVPVDEPAAVTMPRAAAPTDSDSIAAKLERIRAVVGRQPAATLPQTEAEDPAPDMAAEPEPEPAITPTHEPETETNPATPVRARVIRMRRSDFDKALQAGAIADDLAAEQAAPAPAELAPAPQPQIASDLSDADEAALIAELAALQAEPDLTPAPAAHQPEAEAEAEADDTAADTGFDELDAMLSAITAEVATDSVPETATAPHAPVAPTVTDTRDSDILARLATTETATAHTHLRQEPETDEAGIERLLERTEAGLSDPALRGRREALASLKAAVAATEAARRLGEYDEDGEDVVNAFRDDLRKVVRPRRPVSAAAPSAEPAPERPRPAPLKLIASQRVDLPKADMARPDAARSDAARLDLPRVTETPVAVRPRRVTVAADPLPTPAATAHAATAATTQPGFAEFAEQMGAHGLQDLLEAAAAYTSFVEGVPDFSRPQLMKRVTQMAPDTFTREDTLRGFGILLRDGRITRAGTGRFQIAEDSRFNPARRAG